MIDAKKLRIGNIVQDIIGLEKYLIVYKLEEGVITCGDSDFNYPYLEEQLKPIPLTPEILEKCGWVWNKECKSFEGKDARMNLKQSNINGGWTMFNYVLNAKISDQFFYLHQLQNLYFALTATELTINLTKEQQ